MSQSTARIKLRKAGYKFRQWLRKRRLRRQLGREPTFGDIYADMCGTTVESLEFQNAISEALGEFEYD